MERPASAGLSFVRRSGREPAAGPGPGPGLLRPNPGRSATRPSTAGRFPTPRGADAPPDKQRMARKHTVFSKWVQAATDAATQMPGLEEDAANCEKLAASSGWVLTQPAGSANGSCAAAVGRGVDRLNDTSGAVAWG
jgi:hypothetical protein